MHIMHVAAPGGVGGLERVVQMLATAQHAAGDVVRVAGVFSNGSETEPDPFFAPLRDHGVPVHAIHLPARAYRRERHAIGALCRTHRPDVVHLHGYRPDVVDAPAARASGVATVTTVHGFTGGGLRNQGYEWLQRRAIRRCDAVVAVARPLAGRLVRAGVPADRLHFVPNAWQPGANLLARDEARRLLGAADDACVIGWVGRVSREKGLDVLLRAFPALAAESCQIHVIGDGRERPALQALARALGIAPRVVWHGAMPGASRLFAGFDIFALSSRTEGTPIALFEAMAAMVPIVATRAGGVPDVVQDDAAVLVPVEDPVAFGAALAGVRAAPAAAARRAWAAYVRLCTDHGARSWVERYRMVYAAACGARAG